MRLWDFINARLVLLSIITLRNAPVLRKRIQREPKLINEVAKVTTTTTTKLKKRVRPVQKPKAHQQLLPHNFLIQSVVLVQVLTHHCCPIQVEITVRVISLICLDNKVSVVYN